MRISAKLICIVLTALVLTLFPISCDREDDGELDIVASVFVPFDFARTVAADRANVTQLLPPGGEGHDWEPPAKLLREVAEADLFIYVGGGGDKWAEKLLSSADVSDSVASGKLRVLCLFDAINVSAYYSDGSHRGEGEHTHDIDTHFWTSPLLAREMAGAITEAIITLDPDSADTYRSNLTALESELSSLDAALREATAGGGKLYFGDKFAFYYLCREYGLDYVSPYAGCTDDALPIDRVVIDMKEEVREARVGIIFCEEYNSSSALAASIAAESGAAVRELHSCHNLSKSDSEAGASYVGLMRRNIELIEEALGARSEE